MKRLLLSTLIFLLISPFCIAQNVGIGTTTPAATLDVNGDALINSLDIGRGGGNEISNTRVGAKALISNSTGTRNTSLGFWALASNSSGSYNVAQGTYALYNNTIGTSNCAFGDDVMNVNTSGGFNTAIGRASLYNSTNGSFNTAVGYNSGLSVNSGSGNVFLGAGANVAGDYSNASAIGHQALVGASNSMVLGRINGVNGADANTNVGIGTITPAALLDVNGDILINSLDIGRGGGNEITNTRVGPQALTSNTTGTRNIALGFDALKFNTTGIKNVAQGAFALRNNTSGSFNCAFGDDAMTSCTIGEENTGIGKSSLYHNTTGFSNTAVGRDAGYSIISGSGNVFLGTEADAAGDYNNASAIGANAFVGASNSMVLGSINGVNGAIANTKVGIGTTTPSALLDVNGDILINSLDIGRGGGNEITNTRVGTLALASNTSGTRNTSLGNLALQSNTSGSNNVALGAYALKNNTSGSQNCAFGDDVMTTSSTGHRNTAVGQAALYHNSGGSNNTAVGQYSGPSVISGSGNVFVGMSANSDGDYDNASAIGYRALVGASNSMVLGSINGVNGATASTKVGIGTTTPAATLDVVGTINATAWQTASMNGNGFANMGGVLLQWGSVNYNSNTPVTITFPIAFANIYSVTATVDAGNNSGSGVNIPVKVMNIGNNTFQIAGTAVFSGDVTSKIRWMAVGN